MYTYKHIFLAFFFFFLFPFRKCHENLKVKTMEVLQSVARQLLLHQFVWLINWQELLDAWVVVTVMIITLHCLYAGVCKTSALHFFFFHWICRVCQVCWTKRPLLSQSNIVCVQKQRLCDKAEATTHSSMTHAASVLGDWSQTLRDDQRSKHWWHHSFTHWTEYFPHGCRWGLWLKQTGGWMKPWLVFLLHQNNSLLSESVSLLYNRPLAIIFTKGGNGDRLSVLV